MVQVVWTRLALANLETIRLYISEFSPLAGQRMAIRLRTAGESLATHPNRGRTVGGGRRELAIIRPYLIRYRNEPDRIVITRIRHGARRPD